MSTVALSGRWAWALGNLRSSRRLLAMAAIGALLAGAASAGHSAGVPASGPRSAVASRAGLAAIPLGARAAVGATLGRVEPAYWFHGPRAANPAQRLLVGFSERGVRVASGRGSLGLSLVAFGRLGAASPVAPTAPRISAGRVVYARGSLREWYTNSPLGLEQGFDVPRAPAGTSGVLVFSIAVSGDLSAHASGGAVRFSGAGVSLSYGGLIAVDANGRRLPASISLRGGHLILSVDARGARYPLRIDPTIAQFTQTALLATGAVSGEDTDVESVAVSGSTLVVGAPGAYNGAGSTEDPEGAVFVYQEPPGGWASTSAPSATLRASDAVGGDQLGDSVAISGGTIVASAPNHTVTGNEGVVYVFTGSGSSWTQVSELNAGSPDAGTGPVGTGGALATTGSTVVAGTTTDANGFGGVYVWERPGATWGSTGTPTIELGEPTLVPSVGFGGAGVAMTTDTIVAGAPNGGGGNGAAYVYVNAGSWPAKPTAVLTASDGASGDDLGTSVAISSDGNTIVAGAPKPNNSSSNGSAYVYAKPGGGWKSAPQNAELTIPYAGNVNTYLGGSSVGISGSTIAVGAPDAASGGPGNTNGGVYVFNEPGSGWADSSAPNAELIASGDISGGRLGEAVAASGTTVFGAAPTQYLHGAPATYVWNGPFTANTLTVERSGTGSGRVTSSPAGISCPATCSAGFQTGGQVTLTEAPASGSTFAGWSGGGCSGTGTTCRVTMSSAQTVTAKFNAGSPPPPAPHCTIHAKSDKVLTKGKPKSKIGLLTLTVTCSESASVTVRGKVTVQGKKPRHGKAKTHTFSLGTAHGSAGGNVPETLTTKLPASAVGGLKSGDKESVVFTLKATNANGTATATTTISRLHGR